MATYSEAVIRQVKTIHSIKTEMSLLKELLATQQFWTSRTAKLYSVLVDNTGSQGIIKFNIHSHIHSSLIENS